MNGWEDQEFSGIEELFDRVTELAFDDRPKAYRGQCDANWRLQTTLHRRLEQLDLNDGARHEEEERLISSFRERASDFATSVERAYLGSEDRLGVLAIMQHYGAPTRLLDWTLSPFVALYFACIDQRSKDGVIWWFNNEEFEGRVHERWDEYGVPKYPNLPDRNLSKVLRDRDGTPWICALHYPVKFQRMEAQQAIFTVSGQRSLLHCGAICDLGSSVQKGRIVIAPTLKSEAIKRLRVMNVWNSSLGYPGMDLVGHRLCEAPKDHARECEHYR